MFSGRVSAAAFGDADLRLPRFDRGGGSAGRRAEPHGYDLCQEHARSLSAPRGWEVIRLAAEEPARPSADDLLALADAVREVGLSYDPVPGPAEQRPIRRTGIVELGRRGHLTVLADPGCDGNRLPPN